MVPAPAASVEYLREGSGPARVFGALGGFSGNALGGFSGNALGAFSDE